MIADLVRLRLVKRCALYNYIIVALCFASRIHSLDTTYARTWKCTHLPRNLVHLHGTYFRNKFTLVKSCMFEREMNSFLLFSLMIFSCSDICEDQAKSDDIACTVSNGQSSFCIKFDRIKLCCCYFVSYSRPWDRARIPRQDTTRQVFRQTIIDTVKITFMQWNG